MSLVLPIRSERPAPIPPQGKSSRGAFRTNLAQGTEMEAISQSRYEALREFHGFEMIVESKKGLKSDVGLVFSDDGSVEMSSQHTDESAMAEELDFRAPVCGPLDDAREELEGMTLHAGKHRMHDIWREDTREAILGGDDEVLELKRGKPRFSLHFSPILDGGLDCDTPETIMDELFRVKVRMEQIKARQASRAKSASRSTGANQGLTPDVEPFFSDEESDFDPDRYVGPLLHRSTTPSSGIDVLLMQQRQQEVCGSALRHIFPDHESLQEAAKLMEYSVQAGNPDIVACIKRCREEQKRHYPTREIGVFSAPKTDGGNTADATVEPAPSHSCKVEHPSPETLARLVAESLPTIPKELREELQNQRRLLEQLSAAQKESLRRLEKQQQDEVQRHHTASRTDPPRAPRFPETCRATEPSSTLGTLQHSRLEAPLPLIHIAPTVPEAPAHMQRPVPPAHVVQEELQRLHKQYELILRDERKAWADIMQKQKRTYEAERRAAIEATRTAVMSSQLKAAEEMQRLFSEQEARQRQMQSESQLQRHRIMRNTASTAKSKVNSSQVLGSNAAPGKGLKQTPYSQHRAPRRKARPLPPRGKVAICKERVASREEGGEKEGIGAQTCRAVKGLYNVVFPSNEGGEVTNSQRGSPEPVKGHDKLEEVVMLSDEEPEDADRNGSQGQRRNRIIGSQRRPTAAGIDTRGRRGSAPAVTKGEPTTPTISDDQHKMSVADASEGNIIPSSYAFDVRKGKSSKSFAFENTAASLLASSSSTPRETALNFRPFDGGFARMFADSDAAAAMGDASACGRREAEALFMPGVVVLGDVLSPAEVAQQRSIKSAFDTNLYVPSPADHSGGNGLKRPCDIYFYGIERHELTPRCEAELRVAEAQSRLQARRRLEKIKALSLDYGTQKFGEAFDSAQLGRREDKRLSEILSNEVVRCVIEQATEGDLLSGLMQLIEQELVRAEINRILGGDEISLEKDMKQGEEFFTVEASQGLKTGSFFGTSVHESLTREDTLLRYIEEGLLKILAEQPEVEEEKGGEKSESVEEGDNKREENEKDTPQEVLLPLAPPSTADMENTVPEMVPQWVHEVVRAGDDPLRSPAGEVEAVNDRQLRAQGVGEQDQQHQANNGGNSNLTEDCAGGGAEEKSAVVVAVEGAAGDTTIVSEKNGSGSTIKIILDLAPITQFVAAARLQPREVEPVVEHLCVPPPTMQGLRVMSEERRLSCSTEDEALPLEAINLPPVTISYAGSHVHVEKTPVPPRGVQLLHEEMNNLPTVQSSCVPLFPPCPQPHSTPQVEIPPTDNKGAAPIDRLIEACSVCEENEHFRRHILWQQEETLRCSLYMIWDWERESRARLTVERAQQENMLEAMLDERLAAQKQHEKAVTSSPPLLPNPVTSAGHCTTSDEEGPRVPAAATIRDPITKFIFEWMQRFSDDERERASKENCQGSVEPTMGDQAARPREQAAPRIAVSRTLTRDGEPLVEDIRRRLIMEIDENDDSSWLSSDHTSSLTEDGGARFIPQRGRFGSPNMFAVTSSVTSSQWKDRIGFKPFPPNGESTSKTTETTRYSSSLQGEEERMRYRLDTSRGNSQKSRSTPTATTKSSSNSAMPSTSTSSGNKSIKPQGGIQAESLSETLLRHLNFEQPSEHKYRYTAEVLRKGDS